MKLIPNKNVWREQIKLHKLNMRNFSSFSMVWHDFSTKNEADFSKNDVKG